MTKRTTAIHPCDKFHGQPIILKGSGSPIIIDYTHISVLKWFFYCKKNTSVKLLSKLDVIRGKVMIDIDFKKTGGLVPVIAQDYATGTVLMLAYMNRETWDLTIKTGIVHYWSRSRNKIWKKGESSGNVQEVKEIRIDCDNDTVLIKVNQVGKAACHDGYQSCFYRVVKNGTLVTDGERVFDPAAVYGEKK